MSRVTLHFELAPFAIGRRMRDTMENLKQKQQKNEKKKHKTIRNIYIYTYIMRAT